MLRLGSLFSGIGGIELGLERTGGFETVFQVEVDDYARSVLKRHWPSVPRYRDIRSVSAWTLPACDVLAGGFPCQPHSLAGKRKASADERDLWGEFARLICELRPRYVLAENVPGLLSSESGRYFGRVLRDLATLGYDAEWSVLSAAALGAPHLRERVFLVAYPNGQRQQQPQGLLSNQRGWIDNGGAPGRAGHVAHADRQRCEEQQPPALTSAARQSDWRADAFDVANAERISHRTEINATEVDRPQAERSASWPGRSSWWEIEPAVGRVANGTPRRVDRLRTLGNAVVPDCAEFIGHLILHHYRSMT